VLTIVNDLFGSFKHYDIPQSIISSTNMGLGSQISTSQHYLIPDVSTVKSLQNLFIYFFIYIFILTFLCQILSLFGFVLIGNCICFFVFVFAFVFVFFTSYLKLVGDGIRGLFGHALVFFFILYSLP
jgi:hypothetical protein